MMRPGQTTGTKFVYTFSVWPDETWQFAPGVLRLFELLNGRLELNLTPDEFEKFRSDLSHHGLTVREAERVPYVQPEPVY